MDAWMDATSPAAETGDGASNRQQHTDKQFNWLLQTLNDFDGSGELAKYLGNKFVVCDHDILTGYLVNSIRRGHCPAATKPQFIRWAKRQCDRHADTLLPFFLAKRIKEQNGKLTVADVLHIASLHGKVQKDTPCFPRTIVNGDTALIDVERGVLKVPALADSDDPAQNFLPILERLWPFHERDGQIVKSCSRELHSTRRLVPFRIPLHTLFVAFAYGSVTDEPIHAVNGDFLDWTSSNLYRTAEEPESATRNDAQGRFEKRRLLQVKNTAEGDDLYPQDAFSDQLWTGIPD